MYRLSKLSVNVHKLLQLVTPFLLDQVKIEWSIKNNKVEGEITVWGLDSPYMSPGEVTGHKNVTIHSFSYPTESPIQQLKANGEYSYACQEADASATKLTNN